MKHADRPHNTSLVKQPSSVPFHEDVAASQKCGPSKLAHDLRRRFLERQIRRQRPRSNLWAKAMLGGLALISVAGCFSSPAIGTAINQTAPAQLEKMASSSTYAGYYANATGNLSSKSNEAEKEVQEQPKAPETRYIPWNILVFRCWAVDPELCPRCGETMRRDKPIHRQPELSQLLNRLRIGRYPERPPPTPPEAISALSSHDSELYEAQEFGANVVQLFPDDNFNQVPPGW